MSNANRNASYTVESTTSGGRKFKWSVEFDQPLRTLFDLEGIEDPDHQMMVCEALCRIGLAEYRLFGDDTDQIEVQEHCYTSTKAMRKLAKRISNIRKASLPPSWKGAGALDAGHHGDRHLCG